MWRERAGHTFVPACRIPLPPPITHPCEVSKNKSILVKLPWIMPSLVFLLRTYLAVRSLLLISYLCTQWGFIDSPVLASSALCSEKHQFIIY